MHQSDELGLKAGLLLRKMRELSARADEHRDQLKDIHDQARTLQERWRRLMSEHRQRFG